MQNTEKNLGFSNSSTPLIRVEQNEQGVQLVSARELYAFLGVKTDFSEWCKRMFEYGFVENQDFTPILGKSTGGRPSVDYALTLDTAKEIAMMQRTPKGREAIQYFIECEKELRQIQQNPKHQLLSSEIKQILFLKYVWKLYYNVISLHYDFIKTMTGQELKELRLKSGLTQKELADKIGTYESHISIWENGKRKISRLYVKTINETIGK